MSIAYNPYDSATIEDPYPAYAELRSSAAVHHLEDHGLWVIPRYEDVAAVLRDPETFSSAEGWGTVFSAVMGHDYIFGEGEGRNLIATDPPLHTRLRRTVNRAFTAKRIRDIEANMRTIASDLVEKLLAKAAEGPVDIIDEYFSAMPVTVIAEMLGVEPERRGDFKRWANDILLGMTMAADPAVVGRAREALSEYFAEVVEDRVKNPGDDTVSLLVTRGADGEDPLTFDEMVGFAIILLVGGADTTVNMLANWLSAVLDQSGVEAQIRADKSKIAFSVEEAFRYDPVVQVVYRAPTRDVEIGGVPVPKGALLGPLIGSANRDEKKWGPDADRFCIDRDTSRSLALGWGPHLCLGAHLARIEMNVAIEEMFDKVASIERAGPFVRSPNFALRGFSSMPVRVKRKG